IEALAIELAAERFSENDFLAARKALDDYRRFELEGQRLEARKAHTRFHFSLYRASRSTWLLHAIEPVWENSERYRFTTEADSSHREQSDDEHEAILQACAEHNVAGAVQALHNHLQHASDRMRISLLPKLRNQGDTEHPIDVLAAHLNEKLEEQ
ncbi:MAG: FCD domain-containing protein, partial [Microbacteriaceae bacterium]